MTNIFTKAPGAILDYQWDWSSWLAVGETIASFTITAPAGITVQSSSNTTTTVTVWLTGGSPQTNYDIHCTIVTNATPQARTDIRTITIIVGNR